jgi:hypothetical protein
MWTLADLACELDVPEARVRFWIAAGLLTPARNGQLSDQALHRFLCGHPIAWADGRRTPWIVALLTDPDARDKHACGAVLPAAGAWDRYAALVAEDGMAPAPEAADAA